MRYYAHTQEQPDGTPAPESEWQPLAHHLTNVANLAADFARPFELVKVARVTGSLHDLGKYRNEFQAYLRAERAGGVETHHAVYGAALAFQRGWCGPAFAVAGHHAGLHDLGQLQEFVTAARYKLTENLPVLLRRFEQELGRIADSISEPAWAAQKFCAELYIRMLLSVLVDADDLDSAGEKREPHRLDPDALMQRLLAEEQSKPTGGGVNGIRNEIFQQCLHAAAQLPGFFSLTVPTGGGKTLSSMAFALTHAQHHGLRRVIVVIPYLSIIEQNAAQYRRVFDPEGRGIIVENHSAVAVSDWDETCRRSPLELAAENWDAPIIVTTSVQFIESLFANQPTRCRKLHNIARSVIILDEVQTLPAHLLNPLLNVFRDLRDHYGVSFLFCTATQPAFSRRLSLSEGFQPGEVREITRDTAATFRRLRRVNFQLPKDGEVLDWQTLAQQMAKERRALCVVNVRRHAFELWEALRRALPATELDSVFHLSSSMCAEHRLTVLDEVRRRLDPKVNEPCRLVSTQLVEAGVDVDFPVVYRALGPLDSIVQAAGRCNREGRLPALGKVVVFRPTEHSLPAGLYRTATDLTGTLLADTAADALATDAKLFTRYFDQLYQYVPTDYERGRECSIQEDREALRFREVARKARVIEDSGTSVIVHRKAGKAVVEDIRNRVAAARQPRFTRHDLRRLQRFMVNLRQRDFQHLLALKQLNPLLPNLELYVLADGFYHEHLGVLVSQRPTEDFVQ